MSGGDKRCTVIIDRCSEGLLWYKDKIGNVYDVVRDGPEEWLVLPDCVSWIKVGDCKLHTSPLATASAELAEKGTPLVAETSFLTGAEEVYTADVRTFDTGATRDTAEGKSEHVGFNSPLADKRFGEFMHLHRLQSDGELRESSNWKRGIPKQAYIESLGRHFLELRLMYDGHDVEGTDVETTLCAIRFNTNGFLHEILKEKTS